MYGGGDPLDRVDSSGCITHTETINGNYICAVLTGLVAAAVGWGRVQYLDSCGSANDASQHSYPDVSQALIATLDRVDAAWRNADASHKAAARGADAVSPDKSGIPGGQPWLPPPTVRSSSPGYTSRLTRLRQDCGGVLANCRASPNAGAAARVGSILPLPVAGA